jgi:hypothetical protein
VDDLPGPVLAVEDEGEAGLEPLAAGQLDGRPVDGPADVPALEREQVTVGHLVAARSQ